MYSEKGYTCNNNEFLKGTKRGPKINNRFFFLYVISPNKIRLGTSACVTVGKAYAMLKYDVYIAAAPSRPRICPLAFYPVKQDPNKEKAKVSERWTRIGGTVISELRMWPEISEFRTTSILDISDKLFHLRKMKQMPCFPHVFLCYE